MTSNSKLRIYAALLLLGASILLARTIIMIFQGNLQLLVPWVAGLLLIEFILDLAWAAAAIHWLVSLKKNKARLALLLAVTAISLHAFRVLIFVMGRLGPWTDFDVLPEFRAMHYTRWSYEGLYFAAIMSFLGLVGVVFVWRSRHRLKIFD